MIAEKEEEKVAMKFSKECRADPEVAEKLVELDKAARRYMNFDMGKLQKEFNGELETQVSKVKQEF